MRAIILAAGRGRRLEPIGWTKPKCLLEIAGQTLLDRTLSTLVQHSVTDVTLVIGYERAQVIHAARRHAIMPTFVFNEEYDSTNTIHSLWLARESMTGDFLYFNADVLFEPEVVTRLLRQSGSALAVDGKKCGEEEVKIITDPDNRIRRIGKKLDPADCAGEYIGVAKFDASLCPDFVAKLGDFVERRSLSNHFFEAALDELLESHAIYSMPIAPLQAIEIDTPEDLEQARQLWARNERTEWGLPPCPRGD